MTADIEAARKFFAEHEWRFAKTYAKFAPHEYIVRHRLPPEERVAFDAAAAYVNANAKPEDFHGKIFHTHWLDGKKYWVADGSDDDGAVIINRTYPGIKP